MRGTSCGSLSLRTDLVHLFRRVLEVPDVYAHDLVVRGEVSLAVDHVRYHHDLVHGRVRNLDQQLHRLDVEREHDRVRARHALREQSEHRLVRGARPVRATP
jgi:hypothetical protein